jgi:hypothetical protein
LAGHAVNRAAEATGRLIFLSVELSYFLFSFFIEAGLLIGLTAIQFRAEPGTILTKRFWKSGLTSADSGLQLDLEIALSGVSAKIQPHGFFSPAEDALKRRMT